MPVITITPPTLEPVSLLDVKEWCRVLQADTSQDVTLNMLIKAARERAEHITGRAFVQRTLEFAEDQFPGCRSGWGLGFTLPYPPAVSITSIKYTDTAGAEQTLDPLTYNLDTYSEPARVWPTYQTAWPAYRIGPNSIKVRWVAGYVGSTDSPSNLLANMPAALILWMQARIVTRFDQRGTIIPGSAVFLPNDEVDGILDDLIIGTRFA